MENVWRIYLKVSPAETILVKSFSTFEEANDWRKNQYDYPFQIMMPNGKYYPGEYYDD